MAQDQKHNHHIAESDTETQTTQTECQTQHFQYESQPLSQPVWGRLQAKQSTLKSLGNRKSPIIIIVNNTSSTFDLCSNRFTVGRALKNNLVLTTDELPESVIIRLSKIHFEINRDLSSPLNPVYIKDCSLNGTFINGEKLGKDNTRILKTGDFICLAHPSYKTFIFKDLIDYSKCLKAPDEIKKKYYISDVLGSGACGVVYKIYNFKTCKEYAMKIINKSFSGKQLNDPEKVMNEVKILMSLQHPCVIRMIEIIDKPEAVYIILELMKGGDLLHRITSSSNHRLSERVSKFYFYQLCHAVKYLHESGITHRDIKPDNILLETNEKETLLKISDFGLSKFVHADTFMRTFCGTPSYVAPEILSTKGRGTYTKKVDIWSLGVVLFTCLSGVLPFADNYGTSAADQIKQGRYNFKHHSWQSVSLTAKNLIRQMLTVNANNRPNIYEVLKNEWFLQDLAVTRSAMNVMIKMKPISDKSESDDENFLEPAAKRVRRR